jgi:alpha-beta hydrolase superfamily lysophospholipase
MGGLVAAAYLVERQSEFAGAVLSGPAVKPVGEQPGVVLFIGRLLSRIAPKAGLIGLDPTLVSRDPYVVADYVGDPLVYKGKISARLGAEMIDAMSKIEADAAKIKLPVLLMHGADDGLTSVDGSRLLHARIASADKTLKIYDGFYHEIFNDPGKDGVIADMIAWLDTHVE